VSTAILEAASLAPATRLVIGSAKVTDVEKIKAAMN